MYESKPYVLIVDDDPDDLELLSASLELAGIKTKSFSSACNAISYLDFVADTLQPPLLIITDYKMPGITGQQFLETIRQNHETNEIRVVIYSTGMTPGLETALLASGASACFSKPWSYQESITQIEIFKKLACSP
jgi:two-component system, NtrC family, response regulator